MKVDRAKGTRDFPPEIMILRQEVISKIKNVFEVFGFSPLETPIIERFNVLTSKFAAGEGTDVSNEIFRLNDQGSRELALKFDQTVPLARFIAMNPTIKMPFRRYAIDRAFRDGPIKLGRYREFIQCDVDIVGAKAGLSDAEIISLALSVFDSLNLNVKIEIGSRIFLNDLISKVGIDNNQEQVMIALDKFKKIGTEGVKVELLENGFDKSVVDSLLLELSKDNLLDSALDVKDVLSFLGNDERVVFSPTLARGLNYYTGIVFEAFLVDSKIKSSVAGGGRYDDMIGSYIGNRKIPAVGIAFGLAPIMEALVDILDSKKTVTKVMVVSIGEKKEAWKLVSFLRKKGINSEIDLMDKGISKNLDYANYYNIPFVILLGGDEVKAGKVKFKDMNSGDESFYSWDDVISKLR